MMDNHGGISRWFMEQLLIIPTIPTNLDTLSTSVSLSKVQAAKQASKLTWLIIKLYIQITGVPMCTYVYLCLPMSTYVYRTFQLPKVIARFCVLEGRNCLNLPT